MENNITNESLYKEASEYMVGGVNSPIRAFKYAGIAPLIIKNGRGSKVYDYNGKSYIDYVLGYGAIILGHAHPLVVKGLKNKLNDGFVFGATTREEIELAKIIKSAVPLMEKIRFVNSGTEAVMGAIRLARAFTGRDLLVKFTSSYHGHADYLLCEKKVLEDGVIPVSKGVTANLIKDTIIAEYGNIESIKDVFAKYGKKIAAVIVEPVAGNYGVICPNVDFIKTLRSLTKQYGALLIFDEVITGFRFGFWELGSMFCVRPDVIVLGKIIGGGMPIGAFGGREKIMNYLAPLGEVYQAGTFSGNPISMANGINTLKILNQDTKAKYKYLINYGITLSYEIKKIAYKYGIGLTMGEFLTMFSFKFKTREMFHDFYKIAIENGVFFAPSEFEANFISLAHTEKDLKKTLFVCEKAFRKISKKDYQYAE
ncbi:glutamate-1-semialdehyde-2,1-aminomutase [Candidatus Omnitrophus magneticus]|uniref:Glutamate-1-semialdehyde 2,1-aminomutase n=1 Tax=Candidatus Omnitrophus magneticus TaxID=1609969 RepID=A0A0F0CLW5_9BACT|nr:glutamate-1-semialdehyde-2,1-aminomutase [Candidatus Omnitrophus magneticus]